MSSAPTNLHIPPQDMEAEESVLGAMLVAERAIEPVILEVRLKREDFYRERHRLVYQAILELKDRNEAVDILTVSDALAQSNKLDDVGGRDFISTLAQTVPAAGNATHYAGIVKRNALLRRLLTAAESIKQSVHERSGNPDELVETAEKLVFEVAHEERADDFRPVADILSEELDRLEAIARGGSSLTGTPSGFRDLDDLTGGFQPGNLVVIAARPAMGKSALVANIAENVAMKSGLPVAFFSLEMSQTELAHRFIASTARIPSQNFRKGRVAQKDFGKVVKACNVLATAPLFIDDSSDMNMLELRAKSRRLDAQQRREGRDGLGLIMVDYLQLMRAEDSSQNRVEQVAQMSRGLKILARELSVPVIGVSQLSRAPEQRPKKIPMLSDLRECVTGDTLVVLADGRRMPIAELVTETPSVVAVSEDHQLTQAVSDKVWRVGRHPVFEVRLASGRRIKATAKHRLLSDQGWETVRELAPGSRVATAGESAESNGSVAWDRVVSIEPAGEEDVFDLTVPGPACWLADGIVSHNSGQIEQDADLVAFIYREDYYEEDSQRPGEADLIIAKHRNGPIGTVELAFRKEFPKFLSMARQDRVPEQISAAGSAAEPKPREAEEE